MIAKCGMVPWVGSWNRKRALMEKLVNPNKVRSLVNGNVPVSVS